MMVAGRRAATRAIAGVHGGGLRAIIPTVSSDSRVVPHDRERWSPADGVCRKDFPCRSRCQPRSLHLPADAGADAEAQEQHRELIAHMTSVLFAAGAVFFASIVAVLIQLQ